VESWKSILKSNFHRIEPLLEFLAFDEKNQQEVLEKARFCLNVPRRIARKMAKNDPFDPLFLQFVPIKKELDFDQTAFVDPVQDSCFQKTSNLLQKYRGRALLITTGVCAMHCRFCFRQNYSYDSSYKTFDEEISLIKNDPSLHEVILSGGDPFSLPNDLLGSLLERLDAIPHIKLIRFHTRFPIGIPERIDSDFISMLKKIRTQIICVLHINHANELDTDILSAMKSLSFPLLAQTVLLKNVNDDLETLKNLFLSLVSNGIIPYYLHSLDKVQGAMHFQTPINKGNALVEALRKELPGYAVPRFVQEIPGEPNKTLLYTDGGLNSN
jgi:EF-P beta-lysylation protein EpmB